MASIFLFLHLINHRVHQNIFVASHYKILKLCDTDFFFLFCFYFYVSSLLNLSKSLKIQLEKRKLILKKVYQFSYYNDNICKNNSYCYILDLIYNSFQVLVFLFQLLFYWTHKYQLIFDTDFLECQSVLLIICRAANIQNHFIVAAFSVKSFSGKSMDFVQVIIWAYQV